MEEEKYLALLGFDKDARQLYKTLVSHGPLTILEASRDAGIERTQLYRMIDELTARGLVDIVLEHKSRRIRAAEPAQIQLLIQKEKERISGLEAGFGAFEKWASTMQSPKSTQVRYYRGMSGIKQILWNETKSKGTQVAYTYRNLEEVTGLDFFRSYVREIEKNHISIRDLRSDSFLSSTDSLEFVRIHIQNGVWRYLPDNILHLTHNMDIYDDVVAIYYWEENDIFGVEIQNQKIADTQRSIFEALWKMAENYRLPQKYKRFEKPATT